MKERPILFSAPMVRAILERRKTQTRRALKPKFPLVDVIPAPGKKRGVEWYGAKQVPLQEEGDAYRFRCRLGAPGDRLWVRETWGEFRSRPGFPVYRADDPLALGASNPWRPSIFMPRAYSRLTLEIQRVRCQRLNDISLADTRAEGVRSKSEYALLWDSINGDGAYMANPWVWAIDFRIIDQERT